MDPFIVFEIQNKTFEGKKRVTKTSQLRVELCDEYGGIRVWAKPNLINKYILKGYQIVEIGGDFGKLDNSKSKSLREVEQLARVMIAARGANKGDKVAEEKDEKRKG